MVTVKTQLTTYLFGRLQPLPSFNFRRRPSNDFQQSAGEQAVRSQKNQNDRPDFDSESMADRESLGASLTTSKSRASSFMSTRSTQDEGQQLRKQSEADAGPLGLSIVYTPKTSTRKADIVFVHGLGGTSRFTWTRDKNPALFWPMQFLPLEPDIGQARILTFGYNANFRRKGGVSVSIVDFAKDLLFDLRYAKDDHGADLNIGTVPLIFVVHSMGGLIIKEAYIQGQNDPDYEAIVKAISAITFLATPHRGTNLASMLNSILQSTFFNNSKQYINDLNQNSIALQRLNDQFRHIAPKLDIVSFYETRPTSIGLKNAAVMILGKDSSVLGYPGETSKALDADHHNVCKYQGPQDPNYIVVRNALKSLMSKVLTSKQPSGALSQSDQRENRDLKVVLSITDIPDVDYIYFRDQWAEGTSNWILENETYLRWSAPATSEDTGSRVLWLHGGPASGKSVLSSFIINEIVKLGFGCQYFYIRYGEQKKRSLSFLLRSIAYQLARSTPFFLKRILDIADEGLNFENTDARTVWERLFKGGLSGLADTNQTFYWVVDGIDEAANPRAVIKQLTDICLTSVPVRILFLSRKTSDLTNAFQKVPASLRPDLLDIEAQQADLRQYVHQELTIAATTECRESVVNQIIAGAQNNFLWVRLAVDQVNSCHTQDDVNLALQRLPLGMEALYDRMASTIADHKNAGDTVLTTAILHCVLSSIRVLNMAELAEALGKDTSHILDLQATILDLCAGFVVVDNGGKVTILHQTAREYLMNVQAAHPFHIQHSDANGHMFLSCMKSLMTIGLRAKIQAQQAPEFIDYAATFWSRHLSLVSAETGPLYETLTKFLTGPWILTWIHYLSDSSQLNVLIQAARDLSVYFARRRQHQAVQADEDGPQYLKRGLLEGWSVDLIKVVGKFGATLRRSPDTIYKLIPPMCPHQSSIYQLFGKTEVRNLAVLGVSSENWNDSVARISLGLGGFTSSIAAAGNRIVILTASGPMMNVFIFDSSTFEELPHSPIKHGERVQRMALSSNGALLTTYGYRTTKAWDLSNGQCMMSIGDLEIGQRPLTMLLTNDDTELVVGTDDRCLRSVNFTEEMPTWQTVTELEEPELDGFHLNAASCMALNRDGSLIAVAYRGHPLSAWETEGPMHLGHCWRTREEVAFGQVIDAVWNPVYPEIFGLYIEGTLFRWRPYDDERNEISVGASRLSISRDGNLLATGDVRGTIKVYSTANLSLLYQVTSEDSVLGLTFSPDVRRIYDIRGYNGNAWEPNALAKFVNQPERESDSTSETESLALSSTGASVALPRRIDSITVVATSPTGRLHAYGNDKGTVSLHDTRIQKTTKVYATKNFLGIEQMAWSHDGKYLAFCFSGRRVIVMSVSIPGDNKGQDPSSPLATIGIDMPLTIQRKGLTISQLLFHPDSTHLAVISSSTVQAISVANQLVTKSAIPQMADGCKWIIHPNDSNLLMGITAKSIKVIDWDLTEQQNYNFEHPALSVPKSPSREHEQTNSSLKGSISGTDELEVDRVLVTKGRQKTILVQLSPRGANTKHRIFLGFNAEWFEVAADPHDQGLSAGVLSPTHFLPDGVARDVDMVLGFLPKDRLVYLSRDFAVCIWQVASAGLSASMKTVPKLSTTTDSKVPTANTLPTASSLSSSSSSSTRGFGTAAPMMLGNAKETSMAKSERPFLSRASVSTGTSKSLSKPALAATKPLFYLPGDWFSRECLMLCALWVKEKSILCPRNGEIAVVRCAALT